ncbi:MAG: crotonase/enoyl-CoA hydratase family protein [Betaproteobacteria bacterium]|nr:crotonase/enoyl-CoA hydratase family protein [Betaproteobacteria bacterium]MDH5212115.1 crotonase/enoyl-CoA hydratase family protein [Betaproteobacteria bacterium]
MSYEQIHYDVAERIATITLHRPEKLNAFTGVMRDELVDAFSRADADDEVRAVIVTGAGRAFCAGADLSAGSATFDYAKREGLSAETHRDGGGQVTLRIFEMKKPVIAAVNGPAVGIGATMLLPMDVRLCSAEARFGFVFTRRGIVPEACSSWFLPRLVGISQALEWTLSGRVFPAEEALAGRLVSKVVVPDELLPAARLLAKEIVDNTAPVSVALARQMMWRMLGADHPVEAHKVDSRGIFHMGASSDVAEGIAAFREKRTPKFGMRVSRDMPPFYPWWEERQFR